MHHELFLTSLLICKLLSSVALYQQYNTLSTSQLNTLTIFNIFFLISLLFASYLLWPHIGTNSKILVSSLLTLEIPTSSVFYGLLYKYNNSSADSPKIMKANIAVLTVDLIAAITGFYLIYSKYSIQKNIAANCSISSESLYEQF